MSRPGLEPGTQRQNEAWAGAGRHHCETSADINRIESCAYTPVKGFTGEDQFSYVVKDASGGTDSATVYVKVKHVD